MRDALVMGAPEIGPLQFYATPPHQCSYLHDREATTLFADPRYRIDARLYTALSRSGFRRSGEYIYRPHCGICRACIPTRVSAFRFKPRRSQIRTWRKNLDLRICPREPELVREHFELYRRYINTRHPGGGMENPTTEQYLEFLTSSWANTVFFEFRLANRLLAVAVTDRLLEGLSAVYTFFDPDFTARSLGVFTILWQLHEAKRLDKEW